MKKPRFAQGDSVVIPKGVRKGMTTFRDDSPGKIEFVQEDAEGGFFYSVAYYDKKGRRRSTYVSDLELRKP